MGKFFVSTFGLICFFITSSCEINTFFSEPEAIFTSTITVSDKPVTLERLDTKLLASVQKDDPEGLVTFINSCGTGAVTVIKTGPTTFRVVHRNAVSCEYGAIDSVTLSNDGRRLAYIVPDQGKFRMVIDGKAGELYDQISSPVFTPDSSHVAFKAKSGRLWHLIIDGKQSEGRFLIAGDPLISKALCSYVTLEKSSETGPFSVVAYTPTMKRRVIKEIFARDIFFDEEVSRAGAVVINGPKKKMVNFDLQGNDPVKEGPEFDEITHTVFSNKGLSMSYLGKNGNEQYLVLNGKAEPIKQANLGEFPVIAPDQKRLGAVLITNVVYFQQFFEKKLKERGYDAINEVTYSSDGSHHAYAAEKNRRCFIVVNGKEGPPFDRVVSPRFSPDGRFLTYRARQDGKRFLMVADANGRTIRQLQPFEMVFEQAYTADGKSVAFGVKDGNNIAWRVEQLEEK